MISKKPRPLQLRFVDTYSTSSVGIRSGDTTRAYACKDEKIPYYYRRNCDINSRANMLMWLQIILLETT
jgi:hypothetical protein